MMNSAFHELGFAIADELVTKSKLMSFVSAEINKRKLKQIVAGELLGLDQPSVSPLVNEKIARLSVKKLIELGGKLGFDVSIHIEGHGVTLEVPVQTAA